MPQSCATSLGAKSRTRGAQRVEAGGVGGDVGGIDPALPQHQVQQAVEQGDVGAGQDLQVQVGGLGGLGAPRVDDDDFIAGLARPRILDAGETGSGGPTRRCSRR